MSDFTDELNRLRRGRGVMAPEFDARIGPVLRGRAGVTEADQPRQVRDRVSAYLSDLAQTLPDDLRLAFSVGLGLHPDARFRFFDGRMDWLAGEIQRDARTARRRFDEAVQLLDQSRTGGVDPRAAPSARGPRLLDYQTETYYRPLAAPSGTRARIGYVTGDILRVVGAQIWVNPENTQMQMSRPEEHSVSAAIRYAGARHDAAGRITEDLIADGLAAVMAGSSHVSAGTAVCTESGELLRSNNVRLLIHVAAVYGEPGQGYRQVADVGRCLTNALEHADRFCQGHPDADTILVPLLGAGTGGADAKSTLHALLGSALTYLASGRGSVRTILFLAYDAKDLAACQAVLDASPYLSTAP